MERFQNQKWLKIGLMAVAGLLLVGGLVWAGVLIGRQQAIRDTKHATRITPPPPPLVSPIPTFPPETTPFSDETTGWKSYTNTTYGYSIKYPPSLVYAVSSKGGSQVIFDTSLEEATKPTGLESKVIVITVQAGTNLPLIDRGPKLGVPVTIKEEKSLNISGFKGEQVHFDSPINFLQSAVSYKDKVFYFNLHNLKFLEEYNLILSTFRFLE